MRRQGLTCELAAAAIGISTSTYYRSRQRDAKGLPLLERTGPAACPPPTTEAVAAAEKLVREVAGHIGAAPLSWASGLSRRHAAKVKRSTLTLMERERKDAAQRVVVTQAGVLRAFDAMHIKTFGGWRFALISADGSIPYRTSGHIVDEYTGRNVAEHLRNDYQQHGAPLVARADRHSTIFTDEVQSVFDEFEVLVLHGPPRHPRFYGQLERQNREHREWLGHEVLEEDEASQLLARALRSLNGLIPRRRLQWCTPETAWLARPTLDVDRAALRREVDERAAELSLQLSDRELRLGAQHRFAIQSALTARGLLKVTTGEYC